MYNETIAKLPLILSFLLRFNNYLSNHTLPPYQSRLNQLYCILPYVQTLIFTIWITISFFLSNIITPNMNQSHTFSWVFIIYHKGNMQTKIIHMILQSSRFQTKGKKRTKPSLLLFYCLFLIGSPLSPFKRNIDMSTGRPGLSAFYLPSLDPYVPILSGHVRACLHVSGHVQTCQDMSNK